MLSNKRDRDLISIVAVIFGSMLLLLGVLLSATNSYAKPNISWDAPKLRVDGSALPPEDIATYTIEWNRDAGDTIGGTTIVKGTKRGHSYGFKVKANYNIRILVTDKNGVSSNYSEWVPYVLQ